MDPEEEIRHTWYYVLDQFFHLQLLQSPLWVLDPVESDVVFVPFYTSLLQKPGLDTYMGCRQGLAHACKHGLPGGVKNACSSYEHLNCLTYIYIYIYIYMRLIHGAIVAGQSCHLMRQLKLCAIFGQRCLSYSPFGARSHIGW